MIWFPRPLFLRAIQKPKMFQSVLVAIFIPVVDGTNGGTWSVFSAM